MGAGKGMGFCDLRPGVVFGGEFTTRAHFSDRGRRFGFLLGLMATFVIWTWSRALWARTDMVVARRLGRLVRWCCGLWSGAPRRRWRLGQPVAVDPWSYFEPPRAGAAVMLLWLAGARLLTPHTGLLYSHGDAAI